MGLAATVVLEKRATKVRMVLFAFEELEIQIQTTSLNLLRFCEIIISQMLVVYLFLFSLPVPSCFFLNFDLKQCRSASEARYKRYDSADRCQGELFT